MIKELNRIEDSVFKILQLNLSNIETDLECEEYFGHNFSLNNFKIKFRKAKITPTKNGQFVTLWRRNSEGKTEPFNASDDFDFYIIATENDPQYGFFIFPKKVLAEKYILTDNQKEGKRGFRVYPNWDEPESKQAEKTKNWQTKYFIDISDNNDIDLNKFKNII
ncbi:MepB family protein [Chryseobacterium sp. SIMBA_038]|uniref:MepB family protein n=1 Tax=Chryseobacterium sp. SIMBA_038 TaxID=3085780 RepID=UPI00397C303F